MDTKLIYEQILGKTQIWTTISPFIIIILLCY